jgi:aminomethyltransferase
MHSHVKGETASGFRGSNAPERTGLYDLHMTNGAKMVPFAGYMMPVQYSDVAVSESHRWTREKSSLFDVGHMYATSNAYI